MRLEQLNKLGKQEIAGAKTINPIVDFLRGIQTRTPDYILLNENALGGCYIDLDVEAILALMQQGGSSLLHGFTASIDEDGKLTCTAGNVYMPDASVAIAALASTTAVNGNMLYARLNALNAGELVYGSPVTHTLQPASGGNPDQVTLPICTTTQTDGVWGVTYHHVGDFILTWTPYFWVTGYQGNAAQSLDHDANGAIRWNTYGECGDESDSSMA